MTESGSKLMAIDSENIAKVIDGETKIITQSKVSIKEKETALAASSIIRQKI